MGTMEEFGFVSAKQVGDMLAAEGLKRLTPEGIRSAIRKGHVEKPMRSPQGNYLYTRRDISNVRAYLTRKDKRVVVTA